MATIPYPILTFILKIGIATFDTDIATTGVDQCAVITLKYPGERVAQLLCGFCLEPTKEAVVIGTKGTLKLPAHFWCPTKLETPSVSRRNN